MKRIFIIACYADNSEKLNILRKCIESVKKLDIHILLVTHCSVPEDIIKSVNYYIYDYDNTFNEYNFYTTYWSSTNSYHIELYNRPDSGIKGHEWPITKSMRNAFNFANILGYEIFVYIEYDSIFTESDIDKIKTLYQNIIDENQDFIVFEQTETNVETGFFCGKIDKFVYAMDLYFPRTVEEFNIKFTYRYPFCGELLFKEMILNANLHGKILNECIYDFFDKQDKNIVRHNSIKCGVVCDRENDRYYLYAGNDDNISYYMEVIDGENKILEGEVSYPHLSILMELFEYKNLLVKFYVNNGELYWSKQIIFNEITKEVYKDRTNLKFF